MTVFNPCNGVQRSCCSNCIFFGGEFDRQITSTHCVFVEGVFNEMRYVSANDLRLSPDLAKKYYEPCKCFVDMNTVLNDYRVLKGKTCYVV